MTDLRPRQRSKRFLGSAVLVQRDPMDIGVAGVVGVEFGGAAKGWQRFLGSADSDQC